MMDEQEERDRHKENLPKRMTPTDHKSTRLS